jgi:hypothetical protein
MFFSIPTPLALTRI